LRRVHITRNQPGPRAHFRYTEETSAYVLNKGKGGINWYRYQEVVLKPLLLPFARECAKKKARNFGARR
jgi:hypothetical protein